MTWRKTLIIILTLLVNLLPVRTVVTAELQPVVGVTLFGGAERGDNERAGGIGGAELLGLYPLSQNWGIQSSLLNQGGNRGYRLGFSAGPVYAYDSGKVGLFGDYVFEDRGDNNFFFIRGVWSHYFTNFDLVLSYSQPLHPVQHTNHNVIDTICGVPTPRIARVKDPSINELKGVVRYYPTTKIELNAGL